jgi:hypothetical protein
VERCTAVGVTAATFPFLWKLQQQSAPAEKMGLLVALLGTIDSKQSIDETKRALWALQQLLTYQKEIANSAAQGLLEKAVAVVTHAKLHGVSLGDAAIGLPALRLVASFAFAFHSKLDAKVRWAAVAPLYTKRSLDAGSLTIPALEALAFILSTTFFKRSNSLQRRGHGAAPASADEQKPTGDAAVEAPIPEAKEEPAPAKATEEDFPGAAAVFSTFVAEAQSRLFELISRSLIPIPAPVEGDAAPAATPLSKEARAEIDAIAQFLSTAEEHFAGRQTERPSHGFRARFPSWLGIERERPQGQGHENRGGEGGSRKRGREEDNGRDDRNGGGRGRGHRDHGHGRRR